MDYSQYELHENYIREFPIRFFLDKRSPDDSFPFFPHWHEHLELIYIIKGSCTVFASDVTSVHHSGELIFFSSSCPHDIAGNGTDCEYYCITIEQRFCVDFDLPINTGHFSLALKNSEANSCFRRIITLFRDTPVCYRQEIKALCLQILSIIFREHSKNDADCSNDNNSMVAKAIEYINIHFAESISIDDISNHVGFSKFYFCRRFKETTGMTVTNYINFLRCNNAKRLILSGQHNISESAILSGFNNLSYFSRTYSKHIGHPPSEER